MYDEEATTIVGGLLISARTFATLVNTAWILCTVAVSLGTILPGMSEYGARVELLVSVNPLPEDTPMWVRKLVSLHVPKSWFRYFYEWGIVTSLFVFWYTLAVHYHLEPVPNCGCFGALLATSLLLFHLMIRWYECVAVHHFSKDKTMHLFVFIGGLLFYTLAPLSLLLESHAICSIGCEPWKDDRNMWWWYPSRFLSFTLFVIASRIQWHCHQILADIRRKPKSPFFKIIELHPQQPQQPQQQQTQTQTQSQQKQRQRKKKKKKNETGNSSSSSSSSKSNGNSDSSSGSSNSTTSANTSATVNIGGINYTINDEIEEENKADEEKEEDRLAYMYGIPRGGWFELIDCPHYAAELLIYLSIQGFLFSARPTMDSVGQGCWLMCIFWVSFNLSISAQKTHQWYKYKFKEAYPRDRWALIPGLF